MSNPPSPSRPPSSWRATLNRWWCGVFAHELAMVIQSNRLWVRVPPCGYESSGWALSSTALASPHRSRPRSSLGQCRRPRRWCSFGRGPTALKRAPGRVRLNCAASRNDAVHGDVSGRALAWPRWISRPQLPITTSFPPLSPNCRAPRRWWRMAGPSASLIGRQGPRPGDRARCSAVSPAAPRSWRRPTRCLPARPTQAASRPRSGSATTITSSATSPLEIRVDLPTRFYLELPRLASGP